MKVGDLVKYVPLYGDHSNYFRYQPISSSPNDMWTNLRLKKGTLARVFSVGKLPTHKDQPQYHRVSLTIGDVTAIVSVRDQDWQVVAEMQDEKVKVNDLIIINYPHNALKNEHYIQFNEKVGKVIKIYELKETSNKSNFAYDVEVDSAIFNIFEEHCLTITRENPQNT